jgi:hypothetical protein
MSRAAGTLLHEGTKIPSGIIRLNQPETGLDRSRPSSGEPIDQRVVRRAEMNDSEAVPLLSSILFLHGQCRVPIAEEHWACMQPRKWGFCDRCKAVPRLWVASGNINWESPSFPHTLLVHDRNLVYLFLSVFV